MTYWQFMRERIGAIRELTAKCQQMHFISFAIAVPLYPALYTYDGLYPESYIDRHTQPDPSIPKDINWSDAPNTWWSLGDLRKLSELEYQMLEHRPVDIEQLVSEMVSAACSLPAHQGRKVSLLVSKVPLLPPVLGDRDMLGLAFYNLIDNALKFTTCDDAIEVRVREDGRSLFIEVADSGVGIPPQEQERIFEDLYRGENARETEGSGLGLALGRRIVILHRGEISLRSDPAQRRGNVFIIRLPSERKG